MSIDFYRLMEPIDINRLIFIDYIDYNNCFPIISDFHRLSSPGMLTLHAGLKSYRSEFILVSCHRFILSDRSHVNRTGLSRTGGLTHVIRAL